MQIKDVFILMLLLAGCKASRSELQTLPKAALLKVFAEDGDYGKQLDSKFSSSGLDFHVKTERLKLILPLAAPINLLSRFGTPTFAGIDLGGQDSMVVGYFHEALDIARKNPADTSQIRAPVSGLATVVYDASDESVERGDVDNYSTSVVIYDEKSHALVGLLHIRPTKELLHAKEFINVKAGDVIGELAEVVGSAQVDRPEHRHTHLVIMDYKVGRFIDPSGFIEGYRDTKKPTIVGLRFYDEKARKVERVVEGKLDLVVDVFDADDHSDFNQEIASISVSVKDEAGSNLLSLESCSFIDLMFQRRLKLKSPQDIIDVAPIVEGFKPNDVNILRKNIKFGYAVTNLKIDKDGKCVSLEDDEGFLLVKARTDRLFVDVSVYDHFGNQSRESFQLARSGGSSPINVE